MLSVTSRALLDYEMYEGSLLHTSVSHMIFDGSVFVSDPEQIIFTIEDFWQRVVLQCVFHGRIIYVQNY